MPAGGWDAHTPRLVPKGDAIIEAAGHRPVSCPAGDGDAGVAHMALPTSIPILHEPDYRTKTIGTFRERQFFADVTGGLWIPDPDLKDTFAALIHIFDHEGVHVKSVIETLFRDDAAADWRCAELIAELADPIFGNIAIGLFEVCGMIGPFVPRMLYLVGTREGCRDTGPAARSCSPVTAVRGVNADLAGSRRLNRPTLRACVGAASFLSAAVCCGTKADDDQIGQESEGYCRPCPGQRVSDHHRTVLRRCTPTRR